MVVKNERRVECISCGKVVELAVVTEAGKRFYIRVSAKEARELADAIQTLEVQ